MGALRARAGARFRAGDAAGADEAYSALILLLLAQQAPQQQPQQQASPQRDLQQQQQQRQQELSQMAHEPQLLPCAPAGNRQAGGPPAGEDTTAGLDVTLCRQLVAALSNRAATRIARERPAAAAADCLAALHLALPKGAGGTSKEHHDERGSVLQIDDADALRDDKDLTAALTVLMPRLAVTQPMPPLVPRLLSRLAAAAACLRQHSAAAEAADAAAAAWHAAGDLQREHLCIADAQRLRRQA
jgi:hypothetical protein